MPGNEFRGHERRVRLPRARRRLIARDLSRCIYCGAGAAAGLVLDHVEPLGNGGTDDNDNLAAACRTCNAEKRSRSLLRFLASQALQGRRIGHAASTAGVTVPPRTPRLRCRSVAFAPSRLVSDTRCSHSARVTYLLLSTTADLDGWCWPGARELARMADRDPKFASLTLGELERLGYLERHIVSDAAGAQLRVRLLLTPSELEELAALPPLAESGAVHSRFYSEVP
jgi:hypothetical protein